MAMWGRGTGTSSGVVVDCPRQAVGALRPARAGDTRSPLYQVYRTPEPVYGNPRTGVRNQSERVYVYDRDRQPSWGKCAAPAPVVDDFILMRSPRCSAHPEHVPACCRQKTLTVPVTSMPRQPRNTTTPRPPGGRPTPGAAPWSGRSRPLKGEATNLPGLVPAPGVERHHRVLDLRPGGAQLAGARRLRGQRS